MSYREKETGREREMGKRKKRDEKWRGLRRYLEESCNNDILVDGNMRVGEDVEEWEN